VPIEPAESVIVYCDGACSGNPGPGSWAGLLIYKGKEREVTGFDPATTNNRMELMAAIASLEALSRNCQVVVHSDSQYVCKGISEWMSQWIRRGWKTAAGKAVINRDLWERLAVQSHRHSVRWQWVRGHAGNPLNERVDAMARVRLERGRAGFGVD